MEPGVTDLNQVFHGQRLREIASSVWLGRAHDLVEYPERDHGSLRRCVRTSRHCPTMLAATCYWDARRTLSSPIRGGGPGGRCGAS